MCDRLLKLTSLILQHGSKENCYTTSTIILPFDGWWMMDLRFSGVLHYHYHYRILVPWSHYFALLPPASFRSEFPFVSRHTQSRKALPVSRSYRYKNPANLCRFLQLHRKALNIGSYHVAYLALNVHRGSCFGGKEELSCWGKGFSKVSPRGTTCMGPLRWEEENPYKDEEHKS